MVASFLRLVHVRLQRTPGLKKIDTVLIAVWFNGVMRLWAQLCRIGLWLRLIAIAAINRKRLVVVARYGAIGDIICTLPAMAELVRQNPGCRVVYVTRRSYRILLTRSGLDLSAMAARTDLPVPSKPGWIFKQSTRLHHPGELPNDKRPHGRLTEGYGRELGFVGVTSKPKLNVNQARAEALRAEHLGGSCKPLVLLHGGPTWAVKEWPVEYWTKLVMKLRGELGCIVIQLATAKNLTVKDPVCQPIPGARPVDCGDDVDQLLHLVAAVDLVIGVDSGPIHIAGAVGNPCVALFGPTEPRVILSNPELASPVFHRVECSFCHHRYPRIHWMSGCPHNVKCMKELSVEEVFQIIPPLLHGS